jgi:hypothetical protein
MRKPLGRWCDIAFLGLLLGSGQAIGAPQTHTISKSDVRFGLPAVTHVRLKDVVWDLFEPQDYRTKKPPTRQLSHLFLETKTQGTHVPGLCRYDSVEVEFAPVTPNEKGPSVQSKAVGLRSTSRFHFLAAPDKDYEDLVQPRFASAQHCVQVSKEQPFFTAESESEATNGYRIWLRLLDATKNHANVKLECKLTPAEKDSSCAQIVATLKPDELSDVESCDAPSYDVLCHKFYAGDRLITVLTRAYIYPGPPPGEIVSAKVDTLITFADRIID